LVSVFKVVLSKYPEKTNNNTRFLVFTYYNLSTKYYNQLLFQVVLRALKEMEHLLVQDNAQFPKVLSIAIT